MIPRYKQIGAYNELECMPDGELCRWSDVEALIKELNGVRAQALAAVWLVPDGWTPSALQQLRKEACEVFMGKDKQTIAKLQDDIANMQEEHRRANSGLIRTGVNRVYGVQSRPLSSVDTVYPLMITKLTHAPNGGLDIEVQLP